MNFQTFPPDDWLNRRRNCSVPRFLDSRGTGDGGGGMLSSGFFRSRRGLAGGPPPRH